MGVECTGRNIEVTASVRELARRRTQKLERHLGGPASVRVVLSHEKHRFGAEIIATHRRRRWKAQEEMPDPRAALALAFEKIDAQAKKDLARRRNHKHRAVAVPVSALPSEPGVAAAEGRASLPPPETRIVRSARQRLSVKPMSAEGSGPAPGELPTGVCRLPRLGQREDLGALQAPRRGLRVDRAGMLARVLP